MAILGNIPWRDYDKLPGLSWSRLSPMRISPLHYHCTKPKEVTDEMRFGVGAHLAVFEPDQLPLRCVVWDGGRRAGKEWDTFCDASGERTILTAEQYQRCCALRDTVRAHAVAQKYVTGGKPEQAITWESESGCAMKGRLDYVLERDGSWLVDLKTTVSIEPRLFFSNAYRFGYHVQLAAYNYGWWCNTGKLLQVAIVAVEAHEPYDVAVFIVDAATLAKGEEEFTRLLELLHKCELSGTWPGRFPVEQPFELPPWAVSADDELITVGGERAF